MKKKKINEGKEKKMVKEEEKEGIKPRLKRDKWKMRRRKRSRRR